MEDQFIVVDGSYEGHKTLYASAHKSFEDAEKKAKKEAFRNKEDQIIFRAIASVEHVVPDLKVTKIVNK